MVVVIVVLMVDAVMLVVDLVMYGSDGGMKVVIVIMEVFFYMSFNHIYGLLVFCVCWYC